MKFTTRINNKDTSPVIIGPHRVTIKVSPGDRVTLHCEALTRSDDVTLIYWLVDGKFPEEMQHGCCKTETNELVVEEGSIVRRSLLLKNVTSHDLRSTFTCVVTNSAGTVTKQVTLRQPGRRCYVKDRH